MTDNIEMWSLVVGFFLPLGIAVVQQVKWSNGLRSIVAFVICAIAAAGTVAIAGDLTGKTWITSALLILVSAIATYKMLWQNTGVTTWIEERTSPKS